MVTAGAGATGGANDGELARAARDDRRAVHIHWAFPWDAQTFATSLKPKGDEARFEARVRSFAYQEGAPTKG